MPRYLELQGGFLVEWMTLSTVVLPIVLIGLIVFATLRKFSSPCGNRLEQPPTPLIDWPIVGSLPQLMCVEKVSHKYTEDLFLKHGPIIKVKVGKRRHIFIGSAGLAKECLENNDEVFASRPKRAYHKYLSFGDDDLANAPFGEHWQFLRSIYTEELLSPKRSATFKKIRSEELSLFIRNIMKQQRQSNVIYVNLRKRILELVLNMITLMVMSARSFPYDDINVTNKPFGRAYTAKEIDDMRSRGPDWREYGDTITKLFTSPLMEDTIPLLKFVDSLTGRRHKMKRVKRRLVELYRDVIKEHQERREKQPATDTDSNFLDALLSMPGPKGEEHISEETIMGLLQSTVAVGSVSTASTIEWAMSHLLKNPHCMEKIVEELDRVVGLERCVEEQDIPNLPYLRAVVKETFRLTPTGPMLLPHATTAACKVGDYDIRAKSTVIFNVWAMGRNPHMWPNPLVFDPDRFLDSDVDVRGEHFQLFPFGSGKRCCPAIDMSMNMIQFTIARLIQSFTWSLIGNMTPEKLDMRDTFGLVITRLKPLEAHALPRLSCKLF